MADPKYSRTRAAQNIRNLDKGYPLKTDKGTKIGKPTLKEQTRYSLNRTKSNRGVREADTY